MDVRPGLHPYPTTRAADSVQRDLAASGWKVYLLPTGIIDRGSFFRAVVGVLPLDPPIHGGGSWDALADSIWGGIDAAAYRKVAILWMDAETFRVNAPVDYLVAVEILRDLLTSLGNPKTTAGTPTEVAVFLESATGGRTL